tara:strand:- start:7843 stop:7989 length:147 start_codon:yes stop_codon:yes gene_type:complete
MLNYLFNYVVGPVQGGIMVSHGALFVCFIWFGTAKINYLIRRSRAKGQ